MVGWVSEYQHKPKDDRDVGVSQHLVNAITDRDVLCALCEKGDEFSQKVTLYWVSDLTIPPSPRLEDDAEVEADGEKLLDVIEGIVRAGVTGVAEVEDGGGDKLEDQRREQDAIPLVVPAEEQQEAENGIAKRSCNP